MRVVDSILFGKHQVLTESNIPAFPGFDPQIKMFDPKRGGAWLRTHWSGNSTATLLINDRFFAREVKSHFGISQTPLQGELDWYDNDFPLHPGEILRVLGTDNNGEMFKVFWIEYDDLPEVRTRYITLDQLQRYEKRPYAQIFDISTQNAQANGLSWVSIGSLLFAGAGNTQTWNDNSYYAIIHAYFSSDDSLQDSAFFLRGNFSGNGIYSLNPFFRTGLYERPILEFASRTGTNTIPVVRGKEFTETFAGLYSMENNDTDVRMTIVMRELRGFKE